MKYWLYLTTSDNWSVTKEKQILGVATNYSTSLSKLQIGDKLLVFTKQERINQEIKGPYVVGAFEIASGLFYDDNKIFSAPKGKDERYPLRITLKPLAGLDTPVEFKPLVPKLSFITNKQYWSIQLKGRALVELPQEDYLLLKS